MRINFNTKNNCSILHQLHLKEKIRNVASGTCYITLLCFSTINMQAVLADTIPLIMKGDSAPNGDGVFGFSGTPTLNEKGQVAFYSNLRNTLDGNASRNVVILADETEIIEIARQGETLPDYDGDISFFSNTPDLNNTGQVAFRAFTTGSSQSGIFRGDGTNLTAIAKRGDPAPDNNGNLSFFYPPVISDSGHVAFQADLVNTTGGFLFDTTGIFRGNDIVLDQIARIGDTELPNVVLRFTRNPTVNSNGKVGFYGVRRIAGRFSSPAAYRGDGDTLTMVAPVVSNIGTITVGPINIALINNKSDLAFFGSSGGSFGLIRGSGDTFFRGISKDQEIRGRYVRQILSPSNFSDSGGAATVVVLSDTLGGAFSNSAIVSEGPDNFSVILLGGDDAPDGNGQFSTKGYLTADYGVPFVNNNGQVAFRAKLVNTKLDSRDNEGIFIADSKEIQQVVRHGAPLFDSTVTNFSYVKKFDTNNDPRSRKGLNDYGQIAYSASLANGKNGIFLYTPEVFWRNSDNGDWKLNDNWTVGIKPDVVHNVHINPETSLIVKGPEVSTEIRSLSINAKNNGLAKLELATGELIVSDNVTVGTDGVLGGTGKITGSLINNGLLEPGSTFGQILVSGDYTQESDATLNIEIGGYTPASEYDVLGISGNATISGKLDIGFTDGFQPVSGSRFTLVNAAYISGEFTEIIAPDIGADKAIDIEVTENDVVLSVIQIVDIDIKPYTDKNKIIQNARNLYVSILGSEGFDAVSINPDTMLLEGASILYIGENNKPQCFIKDTNKDYIDDLACMFDLNQIEFSEEELVELDFEAFTNNGIPVRGRAYVSVN